MRENYGQWGADYKWIVHYRQNTNVVESPRITEQEQQPANVVGGPLDGAFIPPTQDGARYRFDKKLNRWVND